VRQTVPQLLEPAGAAAYEHNRLEHCWLAKVIITCMLKPGHIVQHGIGNSTAKSCIRLILPATAPKHDMTATAWHYEDDPLTKPFF
jgi:hypothetical protein